MKKTYVSFNTLLKSILVVSSPALVVLGLYVFFGILTLSQTMYAYGLVFLASGALIYPFLSNVSSLTHYVNEIAQDKRVAPPELSFLGMAAELSQALNRLQAGWDVKK